MLRMFGHAQCSLCNEQTLIIEPEKEKYTDLDKILFKNIQITYHIQRIPNTIFEYITIIIITKYSKYF